MWYLKLFEKGTDYQEFIVSEQMELPNVSYAIDTAKVYYKSNSSNDVEEWYSNYMTIEPLEDGLTATFNMTEDNGSVEYCIDNGDWVSISSGEETPSINQGQMIAFKGTLTPMNDSDNWILGIGTFSISKECNLKGNCMSLLFADVAKNHDSLEGFDEAFNSLFYECATIKNVDGKFLPATTLAYDCYCCMFMDCTSLVTAPELPATELACDCYDGMFYNCTSLVTAPELHATTLADWCYYNMFNNCASLTQAPELPATTLAEGCYYAMFNNCPSLTQAPELPATTLAYDCYYCMFMDCTSLVTAPELPATELACYCYDGMFYNCTSLVTAPELHATTLADWCYYDMFNNCASLTQAPELPATTLAEGCYYAMFNNCPSLTQAPELPATTLAYDCYYNMFSGCILLTKAPELPATILSEECYYGMFDSCISLNYIKMLATDISATDCLMGWTNGVASNGTFIKHPNMTSLPSGNSGIPEGWEVKDYGQDNVQYNEFTVSHASWGQDENGKWIAVDDLDTMTTFTFESGMTWREWINSEYNTDASMGDDSFGLMINYDKIEAKGKDDEYNRECRDIDRNIVYADDVIEQKHYRLWIPDPA